MLKNTCAFIVTVVCVVVDVRVYNMRQWSGRQIMHTVKQAKMPQCYSFAFV